MRLIREIAYIASAVVLLSVIINCLIKVGVMLL